MNIDEKLKKLSGSKNIYIFLFGLCSLIILLVVFQAGILVGYSKASFSKKLGDNYFRTFEGKMPMVINTSGGHGAVGRVIHVDFPTFIVSGPDNIEKVVHVYDETIIRHFREDVAFSKLKTGDIVVVIGVPNNNAEIDAKLIRIMQAATSTVQ